MKKPIAIISTDKHLKEENAIELFSLAEQEIALAKQQGVTNIIWLGDIFDSRLSQRQELLVCLTEMISLYDDAGLQILCIPGNHDKTDYESDDSFLTAFKYHPAFTLIDKETVCYLGGQLYLHFIPFYSQDVWLERFKNLPTPRENRHTVLLSHTAVQGSINNDGKKVDNKIKLSLFSKYDKVFLGHYHDAQQPGANVFHIQSTRQNNFGENEEKGFTVLYDDTSFDFVKANFVPYRDIKIDLASTTKEEVIKLAKMNTNGAKFRVTLCGEQSQVKSVNKKLFTDCGISVKVQYKDVEPTEVEDNVARELTGSDIFEKFKAFCAEKGYNFDEGVKLLKSIMQWE